MMLSFKRFSSPEGISRPLVQEVVKQQRRHASGRQNAYPQYPYHLLGRSSRGKGDSNLKYAMRQFLGPKNFKGEYLYNKYFSPPTDHQPNYIIPDIENGKSLVDPVTGNAVTITADNTLVVSNRTPLKPNKSRKLQPFPSNDHCKTNHILDDKTRHAIYHMVAVEKIPVQQISKKFNLKVPRVEAVVRLVELEEKLEKQNRISQHVKTMADTMFKMFPVFGTGSHENLSEIPIPSKALSSRILTLAESEPFGPIDAANVLELEPAAKTLEKLTNVTETSGLNGNKDQKDLKKVVYGEVREGDRFRFKFINKPVGKVGFRYGTTSRDNKKDRKIGFDETGKMIYL
ncbi:HGL177Wp [Eremothecium sinecaudum]|uniref:HGL177Wp n=1 Tax=Eremothecium sinecaudum TaxID=45286 RepID=A0A0X8HVH1_9SACH|nr:HGL177Wp [Eremothecium sinecaudum]AMD22163.1 HGL177Wp [Eremothecium sinecaudum]